MASHTQAKIVIKDQNDVKDAVKGISSDLMDLTQILYKSRQHLKICIRSQHNHWRREAAWYCHRHDGH